MTLHGMRHDAVASAALTTIVAIMLMATAVRGEEPLHVRIDALIAAQEDGLFAPAADDAAFLRRVHLDLVGDIPAANDVRQFVSDESPDKRPDVVDRLLSAPTYASRMTNLFHVMLMERRGDNDDWENYLRSSFAENKHWDQMVREILYPVGEDERLRGAAYFTTRRLEKVGQQTTDFAGLTRDVGRMFLGVDLQCAECHDHLFIDDYKQREFQGLFSVFRNVSIRPGKLPAIREAEMTGPLEFVSVFSDDKSSTGPRVPFGREFEIPSKNAVTKKKPDPNSPPSFSALQLVASSLPSADSSLFRRNIANRVWFCMMGRGLVEPLDQFHSANQASHPQLLQLLANELAQHEFDLKWFIRELVLTQTWQRSTRMPIGQPIPPDTSYRLGRQRPLTAEQIYESVVRATGTLDGSDEKTAEAFKDLKARFLGAFASEPKVPALQFAPAVKQALFLLNDSEFLKLLESRPGNLIARMSALPDEEVADEVYLSVFCRYPTDSERQLVKAYLSERTDDRPRALRHWTWAMLSSMEFLVNH